MFAKVINGVVTKCPYTWDDMRKDNPDTLFPNKYVQSVFEQYGAVEVALVEKPVENHLQSVETLLPEFVNGVLTQKWNVIPATEDEITYRTEEESLEVRAKRNQLLTESDFSQASDFDAGVDKAAWATYRQALRDVPAQAGFPWSVEWPVQPE